jgi:hypothetical protein
MGFFEREIGRVSEQYGALTQLMSAYDSRRAAQDEKPFARGINGIQIWNDGKRYWIASIYWEQESPANPIAAKFLKP